MPGVGHSPTKKVFGDRGNIQPDMQSKPTETPAKTIETAELEEEKEGKEMKGDAGNSENAQPDFERFRAIFSEGVLRHILETVHQNTDDLSEIVEELNDDIEETIFVGDKVKLKGEKDSDSLCTVLVSEKRGGTRMLKLMKDSSGKGKELSNINQMDVKRVTKIVEGDIRDIIEASTQRNGKMLTVNRSLCQEFKIKDKLASIFLPRTQNANKKTLAPVATAGTSSESDDEPLVNIQRRSAGGIAPTRKSVGGTPKAKTKKPKEQKVTDKQKEKEKKLEEKERLKQEKLKAKQEEKDNKEKAKAEKLKKKDGKNANGGMNKFLISGTPGSTGTPFMTPMKRAEKKFDATVAKLKKEFNSGAKDQFFQTAGIAVKTLTLEQIERIPNDLIKVRVMKAYDDNQLREKLKQKDLSTEAKQKLRAEFKGLVTKEEAKKNTLAINYHFLELSRREDLSVCASDLQVPGEPITLDNFGHCLMLSQAVGSLKKFFNLGLFGAEDLYSSLNDGRRGYSKYMEPMLELFVKLLVEDIGSKVFHCGQRLRLFTVESGSLSELCRAFLLNVNKAKDMELNADAAKETDEHNEDEHNGEDVEDDERDESDDPLEMSQVEEEHIASLASRFPEDCEFWQLPPADQLEICSFMFHKVLDTDAFDTFINADYSLDETTYKDKIEVEQKKLDELETELAKVPDIPDDVDVSEMSRIESRMLEKNRLKRGELLKQIDLSQEIIARNKELLETDRVQRKSLLRFQPIGQDRHFRQYFFFGKYSPNKGIFVQNLGTTKSERQIKAAERSELNKENKEENGSVDKESNDGDEVKNIDEVIPEGASSESWSRISDVADVDRFVKGLNEVGSREKALKKALIELKPLMEEQKEVRGRQSKSESNGSEDEPKDTLTMLKEAISELYSDLQKKGLTSMKKGRNFDDLVSDPATTMREVADLLLELFQSIPKENILLVRLKGGLTVFRVKRWIEEVKTAKNASLLFMLVDILHSHIKWEPLDSAKIKEYKKCKSCGGRGYNAHKLMCADCSTAYHYYCIRPQLEEMLTGDEARKWVCKYCAEDRLLKRKKEREMKRQGIQPSEEAEDEKEETPEANDDFFTARRRSCRKRAIIEDSDFEDEEKEKMPRLRSRQAKKVKQNPADKKIREILSLIHSTRIYNSFSIVPSPRPSRSSKAKVIHLQYLESKVEEGSFSSVKEFHTELFKFFEHAMSYFTEKNLERKVEQITDLIKQIETKEEDFTTDEED